MNDDQNNILSNEQIQQLRDNAAEGTKGAQFYPVRCPPLIALCDEVLRFRNTFGEKSGAWTPEPAEG